MSDDIVFIKDITDYNDFKNKKPNNTAKSVTKIKFICSCCGKESIKTWRQLKIPFKCSLCTIRTAAQNKERINKIKETCIKKYGVNNPQKSILIRNNRNKTEQQNIIKKYNNIIEETILNYNYKKFACYCPICQNKFEIDKDLFYTRVITHKTKVCIICNPISNTGSGKQLQLRNYVTKIYNGNIVYNDKNTLNGKEIDIYLPNLKLGFEFDGTYWHADPRFYKESDIIEHKKITAKEIWERDIEKNILCEKSGIQLVRVKEYDWINNNEYEKLRIKEIIENKLLFKNNY